MGALASVALELEMKDVVGQPSDIPPGYMTALVPLFAGPPQGTPCGDSFFRP